MKTTTISELCAVD